MPGKAVDPDETNASYWGAGPYPQWLKLDLGGVYNITGIKIRNYVYGSRYYHYTIEGSIDNQNWTGVASKTNNNPATNAGDSYTIIATARFLRVTMTYNSTSANVYVTDFKVYGTPVGHIITCSAGPGGAISPLGEVAVNSGSDQGFTITPYVGYRISDVLVDNISVGAVSSYEFQDIFANHTISASFLPMTNIALNKTATSQSALSSATVASKAVDADGSNASYWGATPYPQWMKVDLGNVFDITGLVLRNYVYGSRYYQYTIESSIDDQTYTVIATKSNNNPAIDAGDGYALTSTARYLRVNMTYNSTSQNVYVTDFRVFGTPHVFNINSIPATGGSIYPTGIVSVNSGANQTFTITPDVGYQVSNVLVDGVSAGAITSYSFDNVTSDHTITAVFSAMTNVALNKTATSQSALSSATMASKAVDTDGSNSSYWGASPYPQWLKVDLGNLYNITGIVLRNYVYGSRYYHYTIEGSLDDQTYTEIVSKTNSNAAVNEGDSYLVSATARYLRVTMNYNSTSSNVYITDFRVYGTTLGHNIASNAGIGGTITPSGDINVGNESDQTFTITPGIGYQISDVMIDGNSVGAVPNYTFENVTANHTISASFSALTSIALNKPATSQSALSSTTTANKAVDADGTNNSYFGASPYPQWLAVDLGAVYNINGIILRNYVYGSRYYQYRIEGSIDGQSFTEIVSKTNINPATNEGDSYMVEATARYMRVVTTFNSTSVGVYITDFKVFGTLQAGSKGLDAESAPLFKGETEEEKIQGEYMLNVYPNPFTDHLTVRINSPEEETFSLAIINLNGKTVHTVAEIQSNSDNIIYPGLPKGMYILEVKNNLKRMIYRIIKF